MLNGANTRSKQEKYALIMDILELRADECMEIVNELGVDWLEESEKVVINQKDVEGALLILGG